MVNNYLLDRFPLFTDVFGFGYYKVDKNGRFLVCDSKAREIFGIPADEKDLSNHNIKGIYVIPEERQLKMERLILHECEPLTDTIAARVNGENLLLFDICWCEYGEGGKLILAGLVINIRASTISPKMFSTFPRGLYEVDESDKIVRANQKLAELLNLEREQDLLGKSIHDFCLDKDELARFKEKIAKKGSAREVLKMKDGRGNIIEVECFSQVMEEFGKARWGMVTDVTKRERYYKALDQMPTGYFLIEDNRIVQCNEKYVEILGFKSKADAIGKNVRDYYVNQNDWQAYYEALLEKDKKGQQLQVHNVKVYNADFSKTLTISVDSRILRDSDGEPHGREGTIRDVTELAELTDEFEKTKAQLKKTTTDINNLIHTFLHPVVKFSGNAQLMNQIVSSLNKSILPDLKLSNSAKTLGNELMIRLKDFFANLPQWGLDILNREKAGQLSDLEAKEFYSVAELRKSLNMIINTFDYSLQQTKGEILLKGDIRDTALWMLDEIRKIKHLSDNVIGRFIKQDLIDFLHAILFNHLVRSSKVLAGETEIMKREVEALRNYIGLKRERKYSFVETDIGNMLEEGLELFKPVFEEDGITIDYKKGRGNLKTMVSRNDMGRVISNLLHNAKKYSHFGDRRFIKVEAKEIGNENQVQISIENFGVPIMKEELEKGLIFEVGYRGKVSMVYDRDGTGVGLSDAKFVIENHGGSIKVTSEPATEETSQPNYKVPYLTKIVILLPKIRRNN
jgi:PAS domain S-box-containing protein